MSGIIGPISPPGPSEIINLLKEASNQLNKDKNEICKGLSLGVYTVDKWYEELNQMFAQQLALLKRHGDNYRISDQDAGRLGVFVTQSKYKLPLYESRDFINDVMMKYNIGKLRRVVDHLNIGDLYYIRDEMAGFSTLVLGEKESISEGLLSGDRITANELINKIDRWLAELKERQERISMRVHEVRKNLGCKG
jgi:hypothetical protein